MQHGTTPFGHAADAVSPEERQQRLDQTHVSVLDIVPEIGVVREDLFSKQVLLDYLGRSPSYSGTKGRLFVVEDLSSSVIEHLGSHFDIDPSFFRDHITSRVWFSTHDPSFDVPHLASSEPKRSKHIFRVYIFSHGHIQGVFRSQVWIRTLETCLNAPFAPKSTFKEQ